MKLTIILSFLLVIQQSEEECRYFENENLFHLGTKTPYRFIVNKDENEVSYPGCQPKKIFGLIRHGTRTPGARASTEIENVLSEMKLVILERNNNFFRGICDGAYDHMKNWTLTMDTNGEKYLTYEGRNEMVLLAKRLQKRFPSLLPSTFQNETFLFRFTKTQRTEESAKHFALGLFGENGKNDVWYPTPEDPDPILRFYKLCNRWKKEVKKSRASLKEKEKYIRTDEVHSQLSEISQRLGLNFTLSFDTVHLMYIACSFETAWSSKNVSPWCFIFRKPDMKVFEYAEELKYYWRDGYGFDINHQQSCPLFKSIMDFFLNEDKNQKALFYFTHSGTILKALSRLGLFKDSFKLSADLSKEAREARLWKISYIDTFAANLVFVLFKCNEEGDKLLVTHQERPVQLPGCPAPPDLCPVASVLKFLAPDMSCNFTKICSL